MSTKNMKNNTLPKTISIASSPKLDRIKSGLLIRIAIPKIKAAYPKVKYVRLDDGMWIFTSTSDNKAVSQMIRQAETEVIQAEQNLARMFLEEHPMGQALTALTISRLKDLELPEGARPPRFHNDSRQWEFIAANKEVLDETLIRFKALSQECSYVLNPPCTHSLKEHEWGHKFTGFVIKNLRRIPLPKGAKRIVFENAQIDPHGSEDDDIDHRGLWKFACQTEKDLDVLLADFKAFEKLLEEEFTNPRTQPEDVAPKPKKAPAPAFTGMDFPILGSETPALV
jgi:hypothetical protein